MTNLKILIAAALVLIATTALVGCTPKDVSEVGVQRIEEARDLVKNVSLKLSEKEGEDLVLVLSLDNSEKRPLTSAQVWLAYNPDLLKGVSIDTSASDFELTAPYDNDFDQELGLVMLGRSTATPLKDKEIKVAEITFERIGEGTAMVEAYDYRPDLSGHTSANIMVDGNPLNVLLKPQTPLLTLSQ